MIGIHTGYKLTGCKRDRDSEASFTLIRSMAITSPLTGIGTRKSVPQMTFSQLHTRWRQSPWLVMP